MFNQYERSNLIKHKAERKYLQSHSARMPYIFSFYWHFVWKMCLACLAVSRLEGEILIFLQICPLHCFTFKIYIHLTSCAWKNWLKSIGHSHKIHHFHVAMMKGIIYTNLVIFLVYGGCGLPAASTHPPGTNKNHQVGVYYTLYHCHMTNSVTMTDVLQPPFSCTAC